MKCAICGEQATREVECGSADFLVPICEMDYESSIVSAQANNPEMPPELVRECMEMTARKIVEVTK